MFKTICVHKKSPQASPVHEIIVFGVLPGLHQYLFFLQMAGLKQGEEESSFLFIELDEAGYIFQD